MRLRAGLNKQRDRKLFRRHCGEPDLCAVRKLRDTSVLILDVTRNDHLKLEKLLDHRGRIFCAYDNIDDADRLFPTPQRTRDATLRHAVDGAEIFNDLVRRVPRLMKVQAALRFLDRSCKLSKQALCSLWAKTF